MKSLWNAKIGLSSIIVYFVSEKKDEAKQIVRNYIIFAQSQVGDQKRVNFIWQNDRSNEWKEYIYIKKIVGILCF